MLAGVGTTVGIKIGDAAGVGESVGTIVADGDTAPVAVAGGIGVRTRPVVGAGVKSAVGGALVGAWVGRTGLARTAEYAVGVVVATACISG
jgi:hypothetical protein